MIQGRIKPSLRLVGAAVLALSLWPSAVRASPADDKKAEAARLQDELDAQGQRLSIAVERVNKADTAATRVEADAVKAREDLARSDARLAVVRGRLVTTAVLA